MWSGKVERGSAKQARYRHGVVERDGCAVRFGRVKQARQRFGKARLSVNGLGKSRRGSVWQGLAGYVTVKQAGCGRTGRGQVRFGKSRR